jgi:hypothetical protein
MYSVPGDMQTRSGVSRLGGFKVMAKARRSMEMQRA